MKEPLKNSVLPEKSDEVTLGRRELLKALAVGGAATAVSLVPGEWVKPVIEAGVLPAHAQASPLNFTLAILSFTAGSNIGNVTTTGGGPAPCEIEIEVQMTPAREGVSIRLEVTDPPDSPCGDDVQPTDALGVATFLFDATCVAQTVPLGTVPSVPFTLRFSFVDTATYGNDTATLSAVVENIFRCLD